MWENVFLRHRLNSTILSLLTCIWIEFNSILMYECFCWKKCKRFVHPSRSFACFSKNGNEKNMEIGGKYKMWIVCCYKKMIKGNVKMSFDKTRMDDETRILDFVTFWTSNASFLQMNYTSVAMNVVGLNSWALTLSLEGWSFFDARACILRMNSNVSGWFIARSMSP